VSVTNPGKKGEIAKGKRCGVEEGGKALRGGLSIGNCTYCSLRNV